MQTVKSQYDFSKPTEYLERDMFLDKRGGVTVQRFDEMKFPKIGTYTKIARGYFWTPEVINLAKDRQDMKIASEAVQHIVTSNLLRLTSLDSAQGRTPLQVFGPACSLPELESLFTAWGFFETNLHSVSYSHIIQNIYSDPSTVFDGLHEIQEIIDMAANVGVHYDRLYRLNCMMGLGMEVDRIEHKKAIWLALHASYALEAIRFLTSFAANLGMMENRLFVGVGNIIALILQDELLHTEWTAYIIKQLVKTDPDFARIKDELEAEVYAIYDGVIWEEKNWAKHLFKHGVVVGMNENIFCSFVDWTAFEKLKDIGIRYRCDTVPKTHPIPWYLKHSNIDTKQAALQETEATNYVIGMVSSDIDYSELPDL